MLDKVRAAISEYKMILPGELVVVGVSGGPDSLALLHVLHTLSREEGYILHAAHLNHSFRGEEADREALWVQKTAQAWGIPCTVLKEDVPALAAKEGLSPQEAGHLVRKNFFISLLQELRGQRIALGQHADDQAETILMHLLRGAGAEGLQGIRPANPPFIRPLLFINRAEIEEYCRSKGLEPRQDPSNAKNIYLRNKIRNLLLPWLKENINPNLVANLQRTAAILQSEEEYWQGIVEAFAKSHLSKTPKGARVDLEAFSREPTAVQRRIIRYACQEISGGQGPQYLHVEEVRRLAAEGQVGKRLTLPKGLIVKKGYGELCFAAGCREVKKAGIRARLLTIPGETRVSERSLTVKAAIVTERIEGSRDKVSIPLTNQMPKLYCRSRRPGDWLSLPGLDGRKKLKNLFIDRKVPQQEREGAIIIAEDSEVLWIPGLAASKRLKGPSPIGKYLTLEIIADEQGEGQAGNRNISVLHTP